MNRSIHTSARRLPSWLDRGMRRVAGASVAGVSSTSEAINKLNAYIASASPKHDLSTESWRAVWIARFGVDPSGNPATINRDGVYTLIDDIDACANDPKATHAQSCNEVVDRVFSGLNADLGLSADNGWITFQQMLTWLGRFPVNPEDKGTAPVDISDPAVISDADRRSAALTDADIERLCAPLAALPGYGGMDGCRATFRKTRADAQAKIGKIEGAPPGFTVNVTKPVEPSLPSPEKRAAEAFAIPTALGAIGALRWGWASFLVGGAIGVVAATGAYVWTKMRGSQSVTGST